MLYYQNEWVFQKTVLSAGKKYHEPAVYKKVWQVPRPVLFKKPSREFFRYQEDTTPSIATS